MSTFFSKHNETTRIDVFEELSPTAEAAVREFFRKLDAPDYVDEVVIPTIRIGDAQIYCTVRDRPWPPWGLGSRTISSYCEVHSIAPESWAPSPVYLSLADSTNVGLASALYREILTSLAVSKTAEICYLVAEGSRLIDQVLGDVGFVRDDDVFLTEQVRYFTYRVNVHKLWAALGLGEVSTPDLLTGGVPDKIWRTNAFLHLSIGSAAKVQALLAGVPTEMIQLPRGGHASKPAGVPGGTGTGLGTDRFGPPDDLLPYVALSDFLGGPRQELVDEVVKRRKLFRPATVHPLGSDHAEVDKRMRRAQTLTEVEFIEAEFIEQLKAALPGVLRRMELKPFAVGDIELQVTASGHGDYFRMHEDSDADSTRELTFVYFFYGEPRSFSGGELRIFDNRGLSERAHADDSFLISPRQDTIVFFPSKSPHELLPVRVPSGDFGDSRFTINGWIHRRDN